MDTTIKIISVLVFILCTTACSAEFYKDLDDFFVSKQIIKKKPEVAKSKKDGAKKGEKEAKLVKDKNGNFEISWRLLKGYDVKVKKKSKNLKKALNSNVVISGFMIPLDYSAKKVKEFLLVPYIPSCAHVPPPPSNNIIKVEMIGKKNQEGLAPSYWMIKVSGKLRLNKSKKKTDEESFFPGGSFHIAAKDVVELKQ